METEKLQIKYPSGLEQAVHINDFIKMAPISDSGPSVMNELAELDEGERQAIRLARCFAAHKDRNQT
jgi:hypothetical protein